MTSVAMVSVNSHTGSTNNFSCAPLTACYWQKVAGRTLQTLLRGGEYDELEDVVIAEGEFVEADDMHVPIRQLILGMTPVFLLLASRHIRNYKTDPEVYYDTEVDPFTDGLELSAVWPICFLRISYSRVKYQLTVNFCNRIRYYEMTTTCFNGNLEGTWARWVERVDYIFADPYRYIRAQFDAVCLPYPEYYLEQDSQATVGHGRDGGRVAKQNGEKDKKKTKRKQPPKNSKFDNHFGSVEDIVGGKSKQVKRKKWSFGKKSQKTRVEPNGMTT